MAHGVWEYAVMKPIATYTERLIEVSRHFALYDDRVVVVARWLLKGRFETVVMLNTLKTEPRELTIRYRLYRYAGWVLAIGLMILAMYVYNARSGAIGTWGQVALGVAMFGAAGLAATYPNRRIRFVRFDSLTGRGGLDVGLAGNNLGTFEAFVSQIRRQIRRQQG
jgi:hypothetical protein